MQTRRLGRTDLSIAPLVLGGNVFGWTADKKTSFEVLDRFAAAGLTAIDTADVYSAWAPGNSGGESETIIGEWMKARGNRSRVIVITKVGSPMGKGKEGLKAAVHHRGGRSLVEAASDGCDRPLSLALAGHGDAGRRDARRLSAPDQGGQDPLVRRLQPQRQAARGCARSLQGEGAAALRGSAAGIQPRRPPRIRGRPRRSLRSARRSASSPISASPRGSCRASTGARRTSPRVRAATGSRPISIRAGFASSTRSRRSPPATRRSRRKSRSPGYGEARRHRADRQRHLGRADREPGAGDRACADAKPTWTR